MHDAAEGGIFSVEIEVSRQVARGVKITLNLVAVKVDAVQGEEGVRYEEDMRSSHIIKADTVVLAIGQGPSDVISEKAQIATNLRGLLAVDENGMTNIPGVFAAGDVVSGPKTVVEAVAHTKRVAEQMIKYCYDNKYNKKRGNV
jgi:glutamate synthase (NADPH/NADH) small chain